MEKSLFKELMVSVGQALEHAQGKRALRTTELPDAPRPMTADEIRAMRRQVNASQAVFAKYLNVSTKLVQAWEAGRRRPEGAALRLLRIGSANPQVVFEGVIGKRVKAGKLEMAQARAPRRRGPASRRKRNTVGA